jgi:peptide-methionine (S)-S-oxide reductase
MEGNMTKSFSIPVLAVLVLIAILAASPFAASAKKAALIPAPAADASLAAARGEESVVFAGGCFWGIQAVFQHVKGVTSATSGYSGGEAKTAEYEVVSTGRTGHAESVKVVFDPSQITYGELLHVFFSVAHDPTELNRQGPDEGTQYRSVVFYTTADQLRITKASNNSTTLTCSSTLLSPRSCRLRRSIRRNPITRIMQPGTLIACTSAPMTLQK